MKKKLHKLVRKTNNLLNLVLIGCLMLGATILNGQATLVHSYTFDTDASDAFGVANGTFVGGASVADGELKLANDGDYVSFDGAALNLNQYTTVTQEFVFTAAINSNGAFKWQWTSYFGDAAGTNSMMTTLGSWGSKDYVFKQNDDDNARINIVNKDWDDGQKHHMVTVMTPSVLKMYRDGQLVGETAVTDSNIGTAEAFLGKGSDSWPDDPTWMGTIDEYNLYDGEMDATTIAQRSANFLGASISVSETLLSFNESNTQLTFDVTASGVTHDITLTSPTGVTLDVNTIPLANQSAATTVTATWDGNANILGELLNISSPQEASESINVIASIDSGCFTELHQGQNLISDPTMRDRSNYGGWGRVSLETGYAGACGATSILLDPVDPNSWNDKSGSAFDIGGITFEPNTQYGLQFMFKTVGGHVALNLIGIDVTATWDDNSLALLELSTSDTWVTGSYTFTTGDDPSALGITFNSTDLVTNSYAPEVHIDNLELYNLTALSTDKLVKNALSIKVYPNPVKNVLNIDTNLEVSKISIYDLLGRVVMPNISLNNSKSINVSSLSSGAYILHATLANKVQVIKFVK